MNTLTKQVSITAICLLSYFVLSNLFICENAFSQKYWNKGLTKVTYDHTENSIKFWFVVFDYYFGPNCVRAYLKTCDFYFTTEKKGSTHLMRAETQDQEINNFTDLKMSYKHKGTNLVFFDCVKPSDVTLWKGDRDIVVTVRNVSTGKLDFKIDDYNILIIDHYVAHFTVKWLLGDQFKDVKRIRLDGVWYVNGVGKDEFKDVYYDIPYRSMLKSTVSRSENNRVKVASQADAIVITGAGNGENIKVYNMVGVEVKSTVSTSDVVNIKLPKNQIYIINVGQARIKVLM